MMTATTAIVDLLQESLLLYEEGNDGMFMCYSVRPLLGVIYQLIGKEAQEWTCTFAGLIHHQIDMIVSKYFFPLIKSFCIHQSFSTASKSSEPEATWKESTTAFCLKTLFCSCKYLRRCNIDIVTRSQTNFQKETKGVVTWFKQPLLFSAQKQVAISPTKGNGTMLFLLIPFLFITQSVVAGNYYCKCRITIIHCVCKHIHFMSQTFRSWWYNRLCSCFVCLTNISSVMG